MPEEKKDKDRDQYLQRYEDAGPKMHLLQQAIAKAGEYGKEFLTGTVDGIPLPRYDRHHLSLGGFGGGKKQIVRACIFSDAVTAWCRYDDNTNYIVSILEDGKSWACHNKLAIYDFFPPFFYRKKEGVFLSAIWLRKSAPPRNLSERSERKSFPWKWELASDDKVIARCDADKSHQNIMISVLALEDRQQREIALQYMAEIASFTEEKWIKKEPPDEYLHVPGGCLQLRGSFLWLCRL
jgi:hypothetical protein